MPEEPPKKWTPSWRMADHGADSPPAPKVDRDARALRGARTLVASAANLIREALRAWAEDDYAKVSLLAPIAVEHLGKAVLWRVSPTLVVPLNRNAEKALVALATKPDLEDPKIKTVGLDGVLVRLDLHLLDLPVAPEDLQRIVNVRNGATHVGTNTASRQVLLDCLSLCQRFLAELNESPVHFYGDHRSNVTGLLNEKRTEVGHRVAAKRAKARLDLVALEERLGGESFEEYASAQTAAAEELDPTDYGQNLWGVEQQCPECRSDGRLIGRVEVDPIIEDDEDDISGGDAAPRIVDWTITMYPTLFVCCVCKLELHQTDELNEAHLPGAFHNVWATDLSPEFDPERYAEAQNATWD